MRFLVFFTGPASAGAWKSGVGRFLCQVRNLYFFSVNQTVSENLLNSQKRYVYDRYLS